MSLEERVTELEKNVGEFIKEKRKCILCYEVEGGQANSDCSIVAFEFVKQYFINKGFTECDHDKLSDSSHLFADFVYGALLHEVMDYHLREQNNKVIIRQLLSDPQVMDKAFDKYTKEAMESAEEQYEWVCDGSKLYWKSRLEILPIFNERAKELYNIDGECIKLPYEEV